MVASAFIAPPGGAPLSQFNVTKECENLRDRLALIQDACRSHTEFAQCIRHIDLMQARASESVSTDNWIEFFIKVGMACTDLMHVVPKEQQFDFWGSGKSVRVHIIEIVVMIVRKISTVSTTHHDFQGFVKNLPRDVLACENFPSNVPRSGK